MRPLTFGAVLILFSVSLFFVSHLVYGHSGGSSHEHPHDPEKTVCVDCADLVTPGSHYCPVKERQKQEQEVKNSNYQAEIDRLEDKVDDNADKDLGDFIYDKAKSYLSDAGDAVVKVGEWLTGKKGNVKCPSCDDWVSDDKEHWGTGTCQIGHVHWTCAPGASEHHAGCHWVDEPETNPDAMYEGSKYSYTCGYCSNTRWTNSYDEYMSWQNNSCTICGH